MKKLATLVAAIALFAASSVASAAGNLWFSLISSSANVSLTSGGTPGTQLLLNKSDLGAGTARIGVNLTPDATSTAFAGWELSLLASLGGSFANGTAAGAGYDQGFGGVVNGSPAASFGRGSSSAAGSAGLIYSFDLNLAGNVPVAVTGDFGATQGVIGNSGLYWFGYVGDNPVPAYGAAGYFNNDTPDTVPGWGPNPVILVTPEPTTLVLLGLGAVALLRRRK